MTAALWIGAIVVGFGVVAAFAIPSVRREHKSDAEARTLEPVADAA
jgi:hypothetical protein